MSKLQEIKDKFETKSVNGYEIEILAYKEGQEYPIIGMVLLVGKWEARTWTEKGGFFCSNQADGANLVLKKKHLPKDILCEVWSKRESRKLRYTDGEGEFFNSGALSTTAINSRKWKNYKVLKQDPQPWFNDAPCPIPEGLAYHVWFAGRWNNQKDCTRFQWDNADTPITAYQILGEA